MMNDLKVEYPSPELVERHLMEARKLRAQAMRDMFVALGRAITPRRAAKAEPKAPVVNGAVA